MTLEHFELPRNDWYDTISIDEKTGKIRGRIYKDRLIENFNAIEKKLSELSSLAPYNTKYPDTSKFIYSDTTLDSATNKVVNLKSFIDILNLKNVPLSCKFTGTVCNKLTYYNDNYEYKIISGVQPTDISAEKPIVLLNTTNNELIAVASTDTENILKNVLVGILQNGNVYNLFDNITVDLNAVYTSIISSNPVTKPIIEGGNNQFYLLADPAGYTNGISEGTITSCNRARYSGEIQ